MRLRRLSAGLAWEQNPRATWRAEVGKDWFDLIDGSPFDDENDERLFFAIEVVLAF
jgi:hypothetical protein